MSFEAALTILAILLGPFGALWIQRVLDRRRGRVERQQRVFRDLMSTRAARLSTTHVDALNSIEVEFWKRGGSKVMSAWKEYLDHLNTHDDDIKKWVEKGHELFTTLLHEMSSDLGFGFEKLALKKDYYAPKGHGQMEEDALELRRLVLELLRGNRFVWVAVSTDEERPIVVRTAAEASTEKTLVFPTEVGRP